MVASTQISSVTVNLAYDQTFYLTVYGEMLTRGDVNGDYGYYNVADLTMSNLSVYVPTNTCDGNRVCTYMADGGAGNQSVTITANNTGYFVDLVNTDLAGAGSYAHLRVVNGGTEGSTTIGHISTEISHATNYWTMMGSYGSYSYVDAITYYPGVNQAGLNGTENEARYTVPQSATWTDLRLEVTANAVGDVTTFYSQINGAQGNQTAAVASKTTGSYGPSAGEDALSPGDEISWYVAVPIQGGTKTITAEDINSNYFDDIHFSLVANDLNPTAVSADRYWCPGGLSTPEATESDVYFRFADSGQDYVTDNLYVWVSANGTNTAQPLKSRVGGADGNMAVSITAGTTGQFQDVANKETLHNDDDFNWMLDWAGGTGTLSISGIGARVAKLVPDSEELLAKFELPTATDGSEELSAKFAVSNTGSAELLGKAEIRHPGSAELLGKAVIRHVGTPAELLGKFIARQATSEDLLGAFTLRQLTSDLYAQFRVTCPRLMGENWQRKMWYDGTYYWRGRYDPIGDENIFEYITADELADNFWTKNANASIDASGFSGPAACFTVRGGDGTIPTTIHYSDGVDTWVAESDEASATGWAWENTTVVFDATAPDWYRCPNLCADQQGSPKLWATAIFYDQSEGKLWVQAKEQTTSGDITGWEAADDISNVDNTNALYGQSIRAMGADAGVDVMVVYKEGTALRSRYYDGDWDDVIEDIDTTTFAGKPLWDFEHGMTPKMGHVLYVDADGSVQWTERAAGAASVWEAAEEIGAQTSHTHVGLGIIEHGSGWLWATWADQDTVQIEYRLHLCDPETWMPPLVTEPQTFDASTDPPAAVPTSTIAQLQTSDQQPAGSAVIITWIGETAPTTPCSPGWGIIVPSAHEDMLCKFDVGQDSAELLGKFAAQVTAELLCNVEIQQSGSAELLGKGIIRQSGSAELLSNAVINQSASAELLGNAVIQQPGSAELLSNVAIQQPDAAELLGKFEAQATAELLGKGVVKNVGSAELLGKFDVGQGSAELLGTVVIRQPDSAELLSNVAIQQSGSAELLGKFEAQAIAELLGNAVIRQSGSAELLGRFDVGQGSAELLGNAVIQQRGSAELLGNVAIQQPDAAELLGKFEAQATAELLGNAVIRQSGSAELLSRFDVGQGSAELLGKAEVRQSGSAELLSRFDVGQGSAELLGKAEVRQSGSAELLGKFETQAIAELLGKAVIGIESDSAELLGNVEVQQSDSAELLGNVEVQQSDSAELLGKAEVRQSGSAELLGRFEAQGIADLLGNVEVQQSGSAELLGRFEAQTIAELLGNAEVRQSGSAELLGKFETQTIAELLGKAEVRQSGSAELLGRFEAQGIADLLGNVEVQQSGSAELLGRFEAQTIAELLGKAEVRQSGSAELLGKFETQAIAELLGKAVIGIESDSAELLGNVEVQQSDSAELLGKAEVRQSGSAELLGKIETQAIAELLGKAVIGIESDSAELLGEFEVQGSGSAELLGRFEAQVTAELLSKFSIPSIYSLTGITKDKTGNRLGNCEVALFRTIADNPPIYLFIKSDMSDVNGDYSFTNLVKTKYFVRAQKDGSPNIFDTTDNELEPV